MSATTKASSVFSQGMEACNKLACIMISPSPKLTYEDAPFHVVETGQYVSFCGHLGVVKEMCSLSVGISSGQIPTCELFEEVSHV